MKKLNIGDPAPEFSLPDQDGQTISLSDFKGKKAVVLYFYPRDETPGCTKEACAFRDSYEEFTDLGAEVIGVSEDSVRSHQEFAKRRRLPFRLLSDRDNTVKKSYGVANTLFIFPGRETFVIDREGRILHRFFSQSRIGDHISKAREILEEYATQEA